MCQSVLHGRVLSNTWIEAENFLLTLKPFVITEEHLHILVPGSVHDSRILQESFMQDVLDTHMLGKYYLLRDAGYACQTNLLTPYPEPGPDSAREIK